MSRPHEPCVEIPLRHGLVALVDEADGRAVLDAAGTWYAWRRPTTAYVMRMVCLGGRRTSQGLHTFLTGWSYVDHINGDGLDNRRRNLRPVTAQQNAANMRLRGSNRSGYKGVSFRDDTSKWRAYIRADGRHCSLGSFPTAEEAARAYDAAALSMWGEYARLNFPLQKAGVSP